LSSTPQANNAEDVVPSANSKRRGTRRRLWATVAALILLLVGGASLFSLFYSTPEKTLQTFCDASLRGDTATAFQTLSEKMKAKWPYHVMDLALHDPRTKTVVCQVEEVHENGSTATGIILRQLATLQGACNNREQLTLVFEDGAWKIDRFWVPCKPGS
jgi:L-rhamnose mutarotase